MNNQLKLFSVIARIDNETDVFDEKIFIFCESKSEAHLTVKHMVNESSSATCTIINVSEVPIHSQLMIDAGDARYYQDPTERIW